MYGSSVRLTPEYSSVLLSAGPYSGRVDGLGPYQGLLDLVNCWRDCAAKVARKHGLSCILASAKWTGISGKVNLLPLNVDLAQKNSEKRERVKLTVLYSLSSMVYPSIVYSTTIHRLLETSTNK
ncbi:hypothetical protein VTL71DRAFT_4581 [Oculimacula yallundae]|uniref:Uncharacterized protein n=1 Tax=Oculimacula yallundae TaxID=86028 RepID=A0ABR4C2F1_9HELO